MGISNWALDASKQNRGITLSKPDPEHEDLNLSARSISDEINYNFSDLETLIFYLEKLVKGY